MRWARCLLLVASGMSNRTCIPIARSQATTACFGGRQVGNSWRTTQDIAPGWDSVMTNLDGTVGLSRYAGPGGWNDADMLEARMPQLIQQVEVCARALRCWRLAMSIYCNLLMAGRCVQIGPQGKLSATEASAHMALWAILKSPLIIGADLRYGKVPSAGRMQAGLRRHGISCKYSPPHPDCSAAKRSALDNDTLAILTAPEVIAVNQDPLGVAGDLVWKQGPAEARAVC